MKANQKIREAAKNNHVFLWELAVHLGISETTMNRKLRFELPEEEQNRIFAIIEKIKSQREE